MNTPFAMPDEYLQGFLKAAQSLTQSLVMTPLASVQAGYLQQQLQFWGRMLTGSAAAEPVVAPDRGDHRFNAEAWPDKPGYSSLKQSYLLNSRLLSGLVAASELDAATKHRVRFFARQFIDAMRPANYAATDPDVVKEASETRHQSLHAGMRNLRSRTADARGTRC